MLERFFLSSLVVGAVYGILPEIDLNCTLPIKDRIECGYYGMSKEECLIKGCCWVPCTEERGPWCFHRKDLRESGWSAKFLDFDHIKYQSSNGTLIEIKYSCNGADIGRIIMERDNKSEESLLFKDFYNWKASNENSSNIKVIFNKTGPEFSVEREDTMFFFDNLIWENNFLVFEVHFDKFSKVSFG